MSEKMPEQIRKVKIEGAEGEHDLIVGVCITRDDMDAEGNPVREYLLVQKDENGPWYFPGGKVRKDETMKDGLKREIEEEIGLKFGDDYTTSFEKVSAGAYHIKDEDLAIVNVTLPTDLLRGKQPEPQANDAIRKVMWTPDPLKYELTSQVKAVLEAKMGIIKPLGRSNMEDIPDKGSENDEEIVIRIALRYNGEVITGGNHFKLRENLRIANPEGLKGKIEDGYLTSKNRFVLRPEGEGMLERQRISPAQMAGY